MRVLLLNTSERNGGAAIAANRLREALLREGIDAKMLVRDKFTDDPTVVTVKRSWRLTFYFVWERILIWMANHFRKHRLFEVDIAACGTDITFYPEFRQADIVHLHWINQGYLSLDTLEKIIASGKPIVWTMHDMWPFTGICHYSGDCEKFRNACKQCPILYGRGSNRDISARTFRKKERLMQNATITFVACSKWLAALAANSRLLAGQEVIDIPNTIDTRLYAPADKKKARKKCGLPTDKLLLLFTAYQTTHPIKGVYYLEDACRMLAAKLPHLKEQIAIVAVGKDSELLRERFPFEVCAMRYVTDERRMVDIYNAADVFIVPSIQDNLPNTIVEAMACGVPCVGFQIGGIPQMIDHLHNGYVAEYKNAADLANGIHWVLTDGDRNALGAIARRKAAEVYSEKAVARHYIKLYNKITRSPNG